MNQAELICHSFLLPTQGIGFFICDLLIGITRLPEIGMIDEDNG